MIKHFCDVCSGELTDKNSIPGEREITGKYEDKKSGNTVNFKVTIGLNDAWKKGDICKYCVLMAIASLDDRPKELAQKEYPNLNEIENAKKAKATSKTKTSKA